MTELYSWRTDWSLPRVRGGGDEVGGPEEIFVVREQFYLQIAVALNQIYMCDQITQDGTYIVPMSVSWVCYHIIII